MLTRALPVISIALFLSATISCSLFSRLGAERDSDSPEEVAKDIPAAVAEVRASLELGSLLHATAEEQRVLSDPVAEKFPDRASAEKATLQKSWTEASRLYGESLSRLSELNAKAVSSAIRKQRDAAANAGASGHARRQILELLAIHASRVRDGLPLTTAEWEQDYRTLYYQQPASKDPAANRATRILLGE